MSCRICNSIIEIDITEDQEARIRLVREPIQVILPSPQYTSEQRELFISGYCDVCWDRIFPEEDEDDDDDTSEMMELSDGCPDLDYPIRHDCSSEPWFDPAINMDEEEENAFKYGTLDHE